jgi:exopolyphosphatase/guanosine-5'-triphosphate,3'-diphosphate pyrophosphatase
MALTPPDRRAVTFLTPLLRIADALDRSREQRVGSIECTLGSAGVTLRLKASQDIGLEKWAVEGAAAVFREVYGTALTVESVTE